MMQITPFLHRGIRPLSHSSCTPISRAICCLGDHRTQRQVLCVQRHSTVCIMQKQHS